MKNFVLVLWILVLGLAACKRSSMDQTGPEIRDIQTSGAVLVISDCPATSVEISAVVSDPSHVESVLLRYRIAPDQKFTSTPMEPREGIYIISLHGADFLGHAYGTIDFYIHAQDTVANSSQSEVDHSIQFLPCVSN